MTPKKTTARLSFDSKDRALALLRCLIRSRYFPHALPNSAELSRLLRIPRSSLDYALQCHISDALIEPNLQGSVHHYLPPANHAMGKILFVVNTDILRGWYSLFQDWLIGVEEVLHAEGYDTAVLSGFTSPRHKVEQILEAREHGCMGVVLASHTEPLVVEAVLKHQIPAILLGNATIHQQDIGCVCSDNEAGMHKLIDHLLQEHHRRIALYINGLNFHHGFQQRFSAYQHYLRQHGLEPCLDLVFYEAHHEMTARRAAELFYGMTHRPTAIICGSDREAFELVAELRHLKMEVPSQVSVVGFDNNHYGQILDPPITTIDIYSTQMGRVAANYLLNEMQAPQMPVKILLPTDLIPRASTRPLSSKKTTRSPLTHPADSNQILTF
ncbi:MAG: LacI family transcriptional regulator [Blastochloris sp.]|nr:LacI family transcriptional regulator [Blastochloris sp.]